MTCHRLDEATPDGIRDVWISPEVLHQTSECNNVIQHLMHGGNISGSSAAWVPSAHKTKLHFSLFSTAPLLGSSVTRSRAAVINLPPGQCIRFKLKLTSSSASTTRPSSPLPPNPFPPPIYPAYFLGFDYMTSGNWMGTYGAAGFYLAAFDGTDRHRVKVDGCSEHLIYVL